MRRRSTAAASSAIFWRIMVPLITPALVTAAIFSFYFTWGDSCAR